MDLQALAIKLLQPLRIQAKAVLIALDDRRLPQIVRLLLWFALIYFICPFDAKSDFLPGGYIDDSVITPILLMLGLISIPTKIFRESKRLAQGAASGVLCLALLSSTVLLNNESELLTSNNVSSSSNAVAVQNVLLSSVDQTFDNNERSTVSDQIALKGCPVSGEFDDWSAEEIEKNTKLRLSKLFLPVAHLHGFESQLLKDLSNQPAFLTGRLQEILHGQQLQVYDSEDDEDSTSDDEPISISPRPPFLRKGGLLHAYALAFQAYELLPPLHELYSVNLPAIQLVPTAGFWLLYQRLLL